MLLAVAVAHGQTPPPAKSPEFFTGTYHGRPVSYQIINGYAVMEGDMIIGEASVEPEIQPGRSARVPKFRANSNSVNLSSNLWPKVQGVVTVPYSITKGRTYCDRGTQ